jgi:hypothetical protein
MGCDVCLVTKILWLLMFAILNKVINEYVCVYIEPLIIIINNTNNEIININPFKYNTSYRK